MKERQQQEKQWASGAWGVVAALGKQFGFYKPAAGAAGLLGD